jgi:hypothetical protein
LILVKHSDFHAARFELPTRSVRQKAIGEVKRAEPRHFGERRTETREFSGQKAEVETQVMANDHGVPQSDGGVAGNLLESRSVSHVAGTDPVDVCPPDIPSGVDERNPLGVDV